jgi:MFS family permease
MIPNGRKAPQTVLICGALILFLSLGIRHAFGLFLQPVSMASGWGREIFGFAIALQNLVWGAAQPFAGIAADRYGAGLILASGAILYGLGLLGMAFPLGEAGFVLAAGGLVGLGLAGVTFPIVFGAISREVAAKKLSLAFGVAMSVGSLGQFILLPGTLTLIDRFGPVRALLILSMLSLLILPLTIVLIKNSQTHVSSKNPAAGKTALSALRHRGFWLLSLGFFVCGFQVVFIATHLPAFLFDRHVPATTASTVLALIGLLNIVGTLGAGWLGGRYPKPGLLVTIYLGRAVAIAAFVLVPITLTSSLIFGVLMGLFWLSTVPLTNGVVATIFGVKNMSMLGGIVFFAHQVGAFVGGWLGGIIYDRLGSYDFAWSLSIVLSIVAALLNLQMKESPVGREVNT